MAKTICAVTGTNTVSNATTKRWFHRLHSGNIDAEDEVRSNMPIIENIDKIMKIFGSDWRVSTSYIAQKLKISQETVCNHLHKAGLKKKLDELVLHELTQITF